ncbi:MAG: electron transport complex subunit RsxC [Gammaproteobacteria bacterium]
MTLRYTTYHFPGGIHPPERKTLSNAASIRTAALPSHLIIPLSQHIGLEAKPLVQVGQTVLRGQCIGLAQGATSANVHASSSGTVVAIEPRPTHHPSGLPTTCVVIKTDGLDAWAPHDEPNAQHALPWTSDPELLQQRLREAGIVGLGGAGFPTAVKASTHHNGELHTLILNAVECEPYITADDATLRYHAQEVLTGCDWLCRITGIRHVMIGIEDNKPEAITTLEKAIAEHHIAQNNVAQNNIEHENPIVYDIVVVPTKYPSGGEKQLIQLLTGREVPRGTLPAALGILCQNVGTAFAVYRALSLGTPLTSRITTLTGEAIPEAARGNYDVRLGTPITEWLNSVDVTWQHVDRLVMGGPMMGVTLPSADTPIVKVSNCVIAAPFSELPEPEPELPCIRCGLCAEACPASLLPQQLFWHAKSSNLDGLTQHNLSNCIECGACAYVCPSHIPLVQYYRYGKGLLRAHQESTRKSDQSRERFEARQARIDRENAEREAKRQARSKRPTCLRPS